MPTIEAMIASGATCLSVTAGKTLIFDRDKFLSLADGNGISVVGSSM
ncbi:MAG: UDP-2,3-diacylglucosamine diphosphatase LpxI domain-containing protein [Acidobacteriota bacterium]